MAFESSLRNSSTRRVVIHEWTECLGHIRTILALHARMLLIIKEDYIVSDKTPGHNSHMEVGQNTPLLHSSNSFGLPS